MLMQEFSAGNKNINKGADQQSGTIANLTYIAKVSDYR